CGGAGTMRRGPLALGPGGEFDRLRAIFARLGAAARDLGDDAALVRLGGTTLAVSIDLSLEGVHFRTAWLSFEDIGWRATAAAPGDGLWVTGRLGGAGLALAALQRGGGPRLPRPLFRRFARPAPRIAAGRWLARRGARALIDISDGLAGDAGQLAAASGVRAEIALEWLPCWPGVTPRAAALSGEEYELLAALPPRFAERDARAFRRATGLTLTR